MQRIWLGWVAVVVGLAASIAWSAPSVTELPSPSDRNAESVPPEGAEGRDFAWQGEYGGFYGEWGRGAEVGLQVIARGEGRFDAVLYGGGLPGAAWDGKTRHSLSGYIDGESLKVEGENERVIITQRGGEIQDLDGRKTATLVKIKRVGRSLGARPLPGAIVLFDGTSLAHFAEGARMTDDGLLMEGAITTAPVGDFQLHLEFRLPFLPHEEGQARGNSGVYIQQRYEVQILDSFGLEGAANECAGLYRQAAPSVNMCLPPLAWQTYDIFFHPSQWNSQGNKIGDAQITVLHNGVMVHNGRQITDKTGAGQPESPQTLPIALQNHGDPVRFRNIWLKPLEPIPPPREVSFPWRATGSPAWQGFVPGH